MLIAAIESGMPALVEAREIIAAFQGMIRKKPLPNSVPGWNGPARAWWRSAVAWERIRPPSPAAITSPWPNDQTTKLRSSSVRCTIEGNSTCWKSASSLQYKVAAPKLPQNPYSMPIQMNCIA